MEERLIPLILKVVRRLRLNRPFLLKYVNWLLCLHRVFWSLSAQMISFKELLIDEKAEFLYQKNVELFYAVPVFDVNVLEKPIAVKGMEYIQYAIHLKKASVFGSSNIIRTSSNKILYDMPFYDSLNRVWHTDPKILKISKQRILYTRGRKKKINKAIWLGGNGSCNYYHFIYEFAIKFRSLESLDIPVDVPILIDNVCLNILQFKELIDILNTRKYKVIGVNKANRYDVKDLFIINCPHFIPPNFVDDKDIRGEDIQFDLSALKDLRQFLLPFASQKKFPEKVFLSRKNASNLRRFNEAEVMKIFSEFGFKEVFPEELSVADQITLFNQAQYIAGGSGAAFSNLLFCKIDSCAFIFTKNTRPISVFPSLALVSGTRLLYITEEATKGNILQGLHEPFEIDLSYLKKKLIELKI